MQKYVLITLGVMAILGVIIWLGQPGNKSDSDSLNITDSQTQSAAAGMLIADHANYDFGKVSMKDGNVRHMYTVTNSGTESLTIDKMYTSCMCTEATMTHGEKKHGPYGMPGHGFVPKLNETLAPGETAEIEAVFDPNAHGPAGIGKIDRVVRIEYAGKSSLDLQFSAEVTP